MENKSTEHILAIEQKLDKFIAAQDSMNKEVTLKLDKIQRGVYGDLENEQPGLLAEISLLKSEVRRLKTFRTVTIIAGIALLLIMGVAPEKIITLLTL